MAFFLVAATALSGLMAARVSGCAPLPKGVFECGSFSQDPDRKCHKTWTGCAGAGYFSHDGRNNTIHAHEFCIEQGYEGADTELFGASWGKPCRDPFSHTKGFANKVGGPISNLAGESTWKCVGVQRPCSPSLTAPTSAPTVSTVAPSRVPTRVPTCLPTMLPTSLPTVSPTLLPSVAPTGSPTDVTPNFPDMTTRNGVVTFCQGMSTDSENCEFCGLFGNDSWSCSELGCSKPRKNKKACRGPGKKIKCKKITFLTVCASVACEWDEKKSKCVGTVKF